MTLITLQGGLVVLRGGLVGTEQACCCGGDPCIPGCECESGGCGVNSYHCTLADAQAARDSHQAEIQDYLDQEDFVGKMEAAGYVNIVIQYVTDARLSTGFQAEGCGDDENRDPSVMPCSEENPCYYIAEVFVYFYANCCGEIDTEAPAEEWPWIADENSPCPVGYFAPCIPNPLP